MSQSTSKPKEKVIYKSYGDKLKVGTVTSVGTSDQISDIMTNNVRSVPFHKVTGRFNSQF